MSEIDDFKKDFDTERQIAKLLVKKYDALLSEVRVKLGLPAEEMDVDASGKPHHVSYHTMIAAILLENQVRYFARLAPEVLEEARQKIPDYEKTFLQAIGAAVYRSASPEIFSWQPMNSPVDRVCFYRPRAVSEPCVVKMAGQLDAIPEIHLEIALGDVVLPDEDSEGVVDSMVAKNTDAVTLAFKALDDIHTSFGEEGARDLVYMAVDEVFAKFERDGVARLIENGFSVPEDWKPDLYGDDDHFCERLTRISYKIHKQTGRAPGNCLIVGPEVLVKLRQSTRWKDRTDSGLPVRSIHRLHKVGFYANKFRVYMDPMFMGRKVVMIYAGQSILDTGAIQAPYVLTHHAEKMRFRGATKVVNPAFFTVFEC